MLSDFNTSETIAVLGSAVSSISEQALREISGTIREERKREQSKFFAQQKELAYNQGKDEKQTDIPKERTEEHEHHLSDRERSTNTQFNSAGAHPTHRPVRTDAESLSQTAQTEPVRSHDDTRDAAGTSGGSRPDSDTASRADSQTDGEGRGRGRKAESRKSAKMDRTDEQPQTFRRRGSAQTAHSQLNIFDLIDDGNIAETMAREAEQLNNRPAFSFATKPPQAVFIEHICMFDERQA